MSILSRLNPKRESGRFEKSSPFDKSPMSLFTLSCIGGSLMLLNLQEERQVLALQEVIVFPGCRGRWIFSFFYQLEHLWPLHRLLFEKVQLHCRRQKSWNVIAILRARWLSSCNEILAVSRANEPNWILFGSRTRDLMSIMGRKRRASWGGREEWMQREKRPHFMLLAKLDEWWARTLMTSSFFPFLN